MAIPAARESVGVRLEDIRVCQVQLLRGISIAKGSKDSTGAVFMWEAGIWTAWVL